MIVKIHFKGINMEPRATPNPSRRVGYFFAIFFLIVFMVVINNVLVWDLPVIRNYLTPAYQDWLWAGNLSLSVAIFCNVLFMAYDQRWFRHLMQIIQNCFATFSTFLFYSIFPLKLPSPMIEQYVRLGLVIALVLSLLGILAEVIQTFTTFYSDNLKGQTKSN
jgi:hypothetical protein